MVVCVGVCVYTLKKMCVCMYVYPNENVCVCECVYTLMKMCVCVYLNENMCVCLP